MTYRLSPTRLEFLTGRKQTLKESDFPQEQLWSNLEYTIPNVHEKQTADLIRYCVND